MNQSGKGAIASAEIGAATRADLLSASRELFARNGFDGTSVRAITSAAGANLGAVTYHFGSKRALYSAVLEDGLRPLASRVLEVASSRGTAMDRMLRVVDAYFDHLEEHPDLPYLLLQEVAAGKEPPPVVTDTLAGVKTALVQLHVQGMEDGTVRPGHPLLTALSIVSQPVYLALVAPLAKRIGGLDLSDPETRATARRHVHDFIRAGLSPAPSPTS